MSSEIHWRDRAIATSEAISDGFEVLKAYGARIAEWILFFCLIANIIEIFPLPEPSASIFGNIILGIQAVTLDVAGFGLTTMGDHARRRGDMAAAKKAGAMGWTLISVMILTVSLVTLGLLVPSTKPYVDGTEKALILVRVIVTVIYGHIVHLLRNAGTEHDNRVSSLQKQLDTTQKELSSVQSQVSTGQQEVSRLRAQLDSERQRLQMELDTLSGQVDIKQQELESMRAALSTGQDFQASRVSSLQQEVEREQATVAALRRELFAAKAEVERVQSALSSEQQTVSSLRREVSSMRVQLDTGQAKKVSTVQAPVSTKRASTGHPQLDAGQGKVVQLDTRRKAGQDDVEEQIRALHRTHSVQSLSARDIARQVGCSPTTAAKWKAIIEQEAELVVNE